jgi:hypothetical protein
MGWHARCAMRLRRQQSNERFIVDFNCPKAALNFKIDRDVLREHVAADQERGQFPVGLVFHGIRFTNTQISPYYAKPIWFFRLTEIRSGGITITNKTFFRWMECRKLFTLLPKTSWQSEAISSGAQMEDGWRWLRMGVEL